MRSSFLSPLYAVPLVTLSRFELYELSFPLLAKFVEIGLPQLILLVIFSQYIPHLIRGERHVFDCFAVILCDNCVFDSFALNLFYSLFTLQDSGGFNVKN